jgi:hypothetical protein
MASGLTAKAPIMPHAGSCHEPPGPPSSLGLRQLSWIYAYDAYLLVCAIQFGAPLLTLDDSLKVAATSLGITVLEV